MDIKKVFNNNVVLTENQQGQELVVMGRGLAFQKRPGDSIDERVIEKTFVLENQDVSDKLGELLRDVDERYLEFADRIISDARRKLQHKLDDYLYVALADHISFAINRHKQGLHLHNALTWDIRKFYKQEYQIGLKALDMMEDEMGVRLPEDEAASIALHLVNSQTSGENLESITKVTKIVNDILSIVTFHYQMELDDSSISYERFVTHLRFFVFRLLREEIHEGDLDVFLYEQVQKQYKTAFECSERIASYIQKAHGWSITPDEKVYLTLHIQRVTKRQQLYNDSTSNKGL
ncbi:BglG family transcription antiterminator LicT [Risungbinella massiliensis]|uniref:BglG family transcription antiterminator LicT n=1 Tax=Risungbinella massiliensis TaxID=1329796 RepID=UPI0005CC27C6|nr:PRD domain-containing protein [Risungbinella massiliensis]